MNIDLNQISLSEPPIEFLKRYVKKIETDVLPFFEKPGYQGNLKEINEIKVTIARYNLAIQHLEEQGKKTQFTKVGELWQKIENEAIKLNNNKKGLRLCKVEPNTDSFYFHEFVHQSPSLSFMEEKAHQHQACYLPRNKFIAIVEDKKGYVFTTDAINIKFID